MRKQIFTKNNFDQFLSDNNIILDELLDLFEKDEDTFIIEINNICKKFLNTFELPYQQFNFEDFLLDYISEAPNVDSYFVYDNSTETQNNNTIKINEDNLNLKQFENQRIVLSNLKSMIADLESKSENIINSIITTLQQTGQNIPLHGGNICSPKKYLANCPYKLPKGITAIEMRINADSKAEFRCFGILTNKTIYLLTTDKKTSGQAKADLVFDKFIKDAINFIKANKLTENILYNIYEERHNMDKNIFEDLNEFTTQQDLLDYNAGWNAYFNEETLNEDLVTVSFIEGFRAAKIAKKQEQIKKNIQKNHKEIIDKLKKYRKLNDTK